MYRGMHPISRIRGTEQHTARWLARVALLLYRLDLSPLHGVYPPYPMEQVRRLHNLPQSRFHVHAGAIHGPWPSTASAVLSLMFGIIFTLQTSCNIFL